MKVEVRERGGTVLATSAWEAISADPSFAELVDRSILSAEPAKNRRGWRLKAGAFVGRATLGGVDVEVLEKVPGAFKAMARALAPRSFRFARAATKASTAEKPDAILATMLVMAAREYLSRGAEAEYREDRLTGAYVTGRLDVRRTVSLRARGVRHKVAFTRAVLDDDTPLNRSLYSALGVLATLRASAELGVVVSAAARAQRAWFGRSAGAATSMSWHETLEEASQEAGVSSRARPTAAREAAVLASAVLEGATLSRGGGDRSIPRTWFVNLEALFEQFVQKLAADALAGTAQVGSAREWPGERGGPPPLFPERPKRYPSNPDIVILRNGSLIIGDAKYKDFDGWPGASDVHQIVAHAAACGADRVALFYPSDGPLMATSLGPSATGCHAWAFALDLTRAEEGMREALTVMGLAASAGSQDVA